ncbi:KAP family NTPase [Desulfovibrio subterraneus]|uniref:KAP family P-loop NTPase fold protein n=1 Tax=Desulfovibrio subterraneus TaxID=2718620 RepID=UPI0022B861FE|nr:P-loop NTPase fold protein [Desulfovibrio subterraneus]WBF68275.1 KAP family NTPase [Desulfovibrio subterraneus]
MFRRPPELIATPENPFGNDKLGRKDEIVRLTNLMKGTDTPLVMTLGAPWGAGKSSFVRMWKAYLESPAGGEHCCIVFDAWESDFNKEPLLGCMGEIGEFIKSHKHSSSWYGQALSAFEKVVDELPGLLKATAGMATFLSWAVPGVGALAAGLNAGADAAEKVRNYVEGGHSDLKASLKVFKEGLREFVALVTDGGKKPLYFFIDELDRCEPEYAIKLLESVKHFFDVENIIFVLSVDMAKLGSMAQVRYGEGYDASGYLGRFVDVEYTMANVDIDAFIRFITVDVFRFDRGCLDGEGDVHRFVRFVKDIVSVYRITTRGVYRALSKVSPLMEKKCSIIDSGIATAGIDSHSFHFLGMSKGVFIDGYLYSSLSNFYYIYVLLALLREGDVGYYSRWPMGFDLDKKTLRSVGVDRGFYYSVLMTISNLSYTSDENIAKAAVSCSDIEGLAVFLAHILKKSNKVYEFFEYYKKGLQSYDSLVFPSSEGVFMSFDQSFPRRGFS